MQPILVSVASKVLLFFKVTNNTLNKPPQTLSKLHFVDEWYMFFDDEEEKDTWELDTIRHGT